MDHVWAVLWGELIVGTIILSLAIHYFTQPIKMSQFEGIGFTERQEKILEHWECCHILEPKTDDKGNLYFMMPMAFTWAIVCGVEYSGYHHRFCYKTLQDCIAAYEEWTPDMETEPPKYIVRK